jgi:hypothetical protein
MSNVTSTLKLWSVKEIGHLGWRNSVSASRGDFDKRRSADQQLQVEPLPWGLLVFMVPIANARIPE